MSSTTVTLGPVRLSYANIWEPKAVKPGDPLKYSCRLLIPKENAKAIKEINEAIEAAKQKGIESKWGGKEPPGLKMPLRDGDDPSDSQSGRPENAGMFFLNASGNNQPAIVDRAVKPILDKREVYSGCWAFVNVNFYPYNTNGARGVAVGLGPIQKYKDDVAFSGEVSAEEAFSKLDDDADLLT